MSVITLHQAKLLKQKGYNLYSSTSYWNNKYVTTTPGYPLEDGTTSQDNYFDFPRYYAPNQNDLIEWLFKKHKIYIHTTIIGDEDQEINENCNWTVTVYKDNLYRGNKVANDTGYFKSKEEAISAAFDYILENVI